MANQNSGATTESLRFSASKLSHRSWTFTPNGRALPVLISGNLKADSDMPPAAEIWRTLLAEYPAGMSELVLVGRKGRALAPLLCGTLDPVGLIADMRRSHQLDTLYDDSITYRGNRLAIEQLVQVLAKGLPANRRLRILEISAGLSEVPVLVRSIPDEQALAMALIENIQRENLNPLEEAQGLQRLIDEFGLTHQQAADAVGRSRPAAT